MQRDDAFRPEASSLLEFVRTHLVREDVRVDEATPLFEQGFINSINVLDLIGYVEKSLDRRLSAAEISMPNFKSVQAIAEAFFHDRS